MYPNLVYRLLKEHGLIRPKPTLKIEASESWKNPPQSPNEIRHIDISSLPSGTNDKGKTIFWCLIVILDGYSGYILAGNLFPGMTKERCFDVVGQAIFLGQLPPKKRPKLLSENGKQFQARPSREFFKELLNIKQIFATSYHPETNAKAECLFESAKYAALYPNDYSSPEEAGEVLLRFFDYYNNHKLHQSLGTEPLEKPIMA